MWRLRFMTPTRRLRLLRMAGGPIAALLLQQLFWVSLYPDLYWEPASPLLGGIVMGSWWSLLALPVPLLVALDAHKAITCFDCGVYWEGTVALDAFLGTPLLILLNTVLAAAGTVIGKSAGLLARLPASEQGEEAAAEADAGSFPRAATGVIVYVLVHILALIVLIPARGALLGAQEAAASERPPEAPVAGRMWDGRAIHKEGWSRARLESFEEFPLYWLGESYNGLNLQPVPPVSGPYHTVIFFGYGVCKANHCTPRPQVDLRPVCAGFRPEELAFRSGSTVEVVREGAVLVRERPGQIKLWTGRTVITITTLPSTEAQNAAIEALRGMGRNAALQPGAPLPPPDFTGC